MTRWYHGTTCERGPGLLHALRTGAVVPPLFLTDQLVEAQYYADDRLIQDQEDEDEDLDADLADVSVLYWVFEFALTPDARILDLTDPAALDTHLPHGTRLPLPWGGEGCWLTRAGYDAVRYDQSRVAVGLDDALFREDGNGAEGEHHLVVANPRILRPVRIWKGGQRRGGVWGEASFFTNGSWHAFEVQL